MKVNEPQLRISIAFKICVGGEGGSSVVETDERVVFPSPSPFLRHFKVSSRIPRYRSKLSVRSFLPSFERPILAMAAAVQTSASPRRGEL